MVKNIDSIIQSWIESDKNFVRDFDTIREYLLYIIKHDKYWYLDVFENEERENKTKDELEFEFSDYIMRKYNY